MKIDESKLLSIFDNMSALSNKKNSIDIFFILKAWKILSKIKIKDINLQFNTFYNQNRNIELFLSIIENLSEDNKIFKLFLKRNISLKNYDINSLNILIDIIEKNKLEINISDIYFNQKNMGFAISSDISQLAIRFLDNDFKELYIPFTNGFSYTDFTDKKIYIDFINQENEFIIELIKIIDNKDIEFKAINSLRTPSFLNPTDFSKLMHFDAVLSFPPFSVKSKFNILKDKFNRFKIHKGSILDVAHFEHILAHTSKKAVVLMPVGFSFRGGSEELFRKYLIENNLLEAIIQLPPNIHSATSIETTFFIINKCRSTDTKNVLFINLKHSSFFIKNGRKTVLKDIDKIIDIYNNSNIIENISSIVSNDYIAKNNYSLAIDRYVVPKDIIQLEKKLSSYKLEKLEDIANIKKSQLFKDESIGREIFELSPSDFSNSGFTIDCKRSKKIATQDKKYEIYKLETDDILLSVKGTIGKVAIIGELSKQMIASQASQVIRLKGDNTKNKAIILYMFLKSNIGQALLKQLTTGTAMPQISTTEIKKLSIPILSQDEKNQILLNFNNEIKMYNEIYKIDDKIKQIHNNFLGDK